jgi:hypothetical protein
MAGTTTTCLARAVRRIERFKQVQKRRDTASVTGGVLTLLAFGGVVLYGVLLYRQYFVEENAQLRTTQQWSLEQSFPLELGCIASAGCYVSVYFSGLTPDSLLCRADRDDTGRSSSFSKGTGTAEPPAATCVYMAPGTTRVFHSCYTVLPVDAIYIFHAFADQQQEEQDGEGGEGDANVSALPSEFGVSIYSHRSVGLMIIPVHSGASLLSYVHTVNKTLTQSNAFYERREWFSTLLSADVAEVPHPAVASCDAIMPHNVSGMHATKLSQNPAYTEVEVYRESQLLPFLGNLGGMAKIVFSTLSIFVLLYAMFACPEDRTRRKLQFGNSSSSSSSSASDADDDHHHTLNRGAAQTGDAAAAATSNYQPLIESIMYIVCFYI